MLHTNKIIRPCEGKATAVRTEARKLSNIEIKFISRHQKQLPLVLRVCKIRGDILKFFTESIDNAKCEHSEYGASAAHRPRCSLPVPPLFDLRDP